MEALSKRATNRTMDGEKSLSQQQLSDLLWAAWGINREDGRRTAPAELTVLQEEPERTVVSITLREGRNRQIRRMCELLGLEVIRLKRTAVGSVKLGMLPPGKWRDLTPQEVKALVVASQVPEKVAAGYIKNGRPGGQRGRGRADNRSRR